MVMNLLPDLLTARNWTAGALRQQAATMATANAWLLPFFLLVFSIVFVPLRILDDEGLPRYRALRDELARLELENGRMRLELQQSQVNVRALRSEPQSLERIARDELGMLRKGEILFQFED